MTSGRFNRLQKNAERSAVSKARKCWRNRLRIQVFFKYFASYKCESLPLVQIAPHRIAMLPVPSGHLN